ncbi:MAG: transcription initiation factor IIE [Clostridiales bacterium]|nr:transcription initiation factor IIE [Clostridiales bacterium]
MKYEETYAQFDPGLLDTVKRAIPASFADNLKSSGIEFVPDDRELELKVKYDVREEGGAFSLKFSWDYDPGDADEDEGED